MTEATPTPDTATPAAPSRYTYIGRRVIKAGKLVHAFYEGEQTEILSFWPKAKPSRFTGAVIGAVYALDGGPPAFWSSAKVGAVPPEQAAVWEGADRAAYLSTQERKTEAAPQLAEALATLRKARDGVGYAQRLAFDLWVLQSIKGRG